MATIDNLTLEITANSTKAVANIEKLATALGALKNASKGISSANLTKVAGAITEIKTACAGISMSSVHRVERITDALERLSKINGIGRITNAVAKAGQLPIAPVTTPIQQAPIESEKTQIEETAEAMVSAETPAKNLSTSLKSIAINAKNIGLTMLKNEIKSFGDTLKRVLSPLRGFIKALGRIAFYRFIRSIIKSITQGIKEGIQNLALYSKALNETDSAQANKTMSELATSFLYLKNSIGATIMPILQQFTPAIQKVVEVCVSALNIINQIISVLQGKNTFTKAKVYWVDYAGSLDKTAKSAKALHHQLAGFDELNNLTAPSGSGSAVQDTSQMFEEAFIDTKILDTINKIKEKFDDILRIVTSIGAGILAWKLASSFTNALSLLFGLSKMGALGLTLGLTLMVAGFTLEGLSIADIIKNGLDLSNFGTSVGGAILASLGSFLTGSVFASLFGASLLTGIIGGIGTVVAGLGLAVAGIWESIVKGIDWLSAILTAIGTTLTGAGIGAIIGAIVGSEGGPVGIIIGAVAGFIIGAIVNIVIAVVQHWEELKEWTANAWENIKLAVVNAGQVVYTFLTEKLPYAIGYVAGKFVSWVKDDLPVIIANLIVFFTSLPTLIKLKLVDVKNKFIEWKNDMVKWVKEKIPEITKAILYVFSGDFLTDVFNIGVDFIKNIWEGIKSKGAWLLTNIGDFFSETFSKISENFSVGFKAGSSSIPKYANGGFVESGNLFIANERGAEMVGSINGNTAVANNDQITEAIAQATYTAMSKALSENGGSVSIVVEGDGDKMFKVWQKKQREYQRATGLAY